VAAVPGVVLVNPKAGSELSADELRKLFAGHRIADCPGGDIPDRVAGALADKPDFVAVAGGDGTVRAAAQGLAHSGVPVGILPQGTGNLLARNLEIPQDDDEALEVALCGADRTLDLGRLDDGTAFAVMAGTGFDAAIMESTPEALKVKVGPLAYVISGLRAMRGRRIRVNLSLDDGPPLRRRTRTVLVGNSGTLLGGLVLMPRATIDDGVLDVVSIAPGTLAGWVAVALRVITKRPRGHERVEHWQARSIVIRTETPQPCQVDGDPVGNAQELSICVDPRALVLRVPDVPPPGTPDAG
jgi:YegS/Rv2252/BmrU family lipid kinase